MKINKILWQSNIEIESEFYDVLIPLPANHDVCMKNIGIDEFEDSDEEWDEDFNRILEQLVDNNQFVVKSYTPETREEEVIQNARLRDIQGHLAYNDHLHFTVEVENREIVFTRGHEIFWLKGFSVDAINKIEAVLEPIQNPNIKQIF